MKVSDIMVEPVRVDKSDTLSHALELMEKQRTRRLLVTRNSSFYGVVTIRSIARELGSWKKSNLPASSLHVATALVDTYTKVLPDLKLEDAITLMDKNKSVLVVTSGDDEVLGWVTPSEILKDIKAIPGYAAEVMKEPITAGPADRVAHIRKVMLDHDIGRLPVVNDHKLVGIVTETDVARALHAFRGLVSDSQQDARIRNLIVEDIMTVNPISVKTNTPLSDVVDLMLKENIGGMPVLNLEEDLVGVISRRDIIGVLARSK